MITNLNTMKANDLTINNYNGHFKWFNVYFILYYNNKTTIKGFK